MNINARIATMILRCQNTSDGGKSIYDLIYNRRGYRDNIAGYDVKDKYILETIRLISGTKNDFKYSVQRDKEGIALFIVYFEVKINGEKLQVSFHSFNRELHRFINHGFRMKWDRGDSRLSAEKIYIHYVPNGEYLDIPNGEYLGGDAYD